MRKLLLVILTCFLLTNLAFAEEVNNEMYYKRQIQNMRLPYSEAGMMNSITQNQADVLELYIKSGYSPNSTFMGTSMLTTAVNKGRYECMKVLLENGADPNTAIFPTLNVLVYAIERKDSTAVKYLIDYKADVNKRINGLTPLYYAVSKKQPKIAEMLLNAGAAPDLSTINRVKKSKDEYLKDLFSEYLD